MELFTRDLFQHLHATNVDVDNIIGQFFQWTIVARWRYIGVENAETVARSRVIYSRKC